uniref:Uncharacterized protein n=1 Tax=Rhizophora mucronata TaxID=61149 RepID=A0A2P2PD60_RHIMU
MQPLLYLCPRLAFPLARFWTMRWRICWHLNSCP